MKLVEQFDNLGEEAKQAVMQELSKRALLAVNESMNAKKQDTKTEQVEDKSE